LLEGSSINLSTAARLVAAVVWAVKQFKPCVNWATFENRSRSQISQMRIQ